MYILILILIIGWLIGIFYNALNCHDISQSVYYITVTIYLKYMSCMYI